MRRKPAEFAIWRVGGLNSDCGDKWLKESRGISSGGQVLWLLILKKGLSLNVLIVSSVGPFCSAFCLFLFRFDVYTVASE